MVVGEFSQETEFAIIGGGPAGYTAAFCAAGLGVNPIVIDPRSSLGGVCLHEGCVPSKTLLHIAECIRTARRAATMGVTFAEPTIDLDAVRAWVQSAVEKLGRGLNAVQKSHKIERLEGLARFDDSRNLTVTNGTVSRVKFKRALIATGSTPMPHPLLPPDHPCVWTAPRAMQLDVVPERLLVIGATFNAIELAMIFAALGSAVTLISDQQSILPAADDDLARPLLKSLRDQLSAVHLATEIAAASAEDDAVSVRLRSTKTDAADADDEAPPQRFYRVIVAMGNEASLEGLALNKTQVKTDKQGFVTVDQQMHTTDPRIFAAGDVAGPPLLADTAMHQARVVAEVICGWDSAFDPYAVPMALFTDPQVAWCGMTEKQAAEQGRDVRITRMPWGASGRAVGMNRADGATKLISEPDTGLILGVGIVGPGAVEMIGEGALAIEMGATTTDLAATIHPHPTTVELLSESAARALSADNSSES